MSTTTLLAFLASGVFLIRLLPQPVRLLRHQIDAGVSPLAAMNALIADLAWLAYGLWTGIPAVWIVSVLALVPEVWTVVLLRQKARWSDVGWAALWAAAILLSAPLGLLAAALGAGVVVTQGPQVLMAIREDDLRGIAPSTWRLALADALCWGAYGWAIGDPALLGYFAVLSTSAVIVLVRLRQTGSYGAELAVEPVASR
jgi:uncharacterized protein with PQ loop repeat